MDKSLHLLKHNRVFTQVTEDVQFNKFFYGFSLTDNFEDIKDMITNTVPILIYFRQSWNNNGRHE